MSILTKGEREFIQGNLDDGLKMRRGERQDQALATICENFFQDALDTIDALEEYAEYLKESHKETHLGLLRTRDELIDKLDAMERIIKGIESATSMQQVETVLVAARAFGVIEEEAE